MPVVFIPIRTPHPSSRTEQKKKHDKNKQVKRLFYPQKALSSNKPKELWQVIHRIPHPNPEPLKVDPDLLNNRFTSTSQRLLGSTPNSPHALQELINSLSDSSTSSFDLVTYC